MKDYLRSKIRDVPDFPKKGILFKDITTLIKDAKAFESVVSAFYEYFKDKTSEENGTPINRENLMAIQGFIANDTIFNADGSITETNSKDETLTTVFNDDGSITETFVGEKTIIKTTSFNEDGSIKEVIS